MKYDILVFDTVNLYYRALWKNEDRTQTISNRTIRTGGILKSLQMIRKRIDQYLLPDGKVYFLFDNPTSRQDLRKAMTQGSQYEYKSNRENLSPSFFAGINYLSSLLTYWQDNAYVIQGHKTEADDFVDPIVVNNPDSDILVISTDMDWARVISDTTHWLDRGIIYTPEIFEEKYKFYPTRASVCFYKAFYGDKVDNILPALQQLPKVYFRDIAVRSDNMYQFIEQALGGDYDDILDEGWKLRISRDKNFLMTNWKLVDFIGLTNADLIRHSTKCKFKPDALSLLYATYGFELSEVDERIAPPKQTGDSLLNSMLQGEKRKRK